MALAAKAGALLAARAHAPVAAGPSLRLFVPRHIST